MFFVNFWRFHFNLNFFRPRFDNIRMNFNSTVRSASIILVPFIKKNYRRRQLRVTRVWKKNQMCFLFAYNFAYVKRVQIRKTNFDNLLLHKKRELLFLEGEKNDFICMQIVWHLNLKKILICTWEYFYSALRCTWWKSSHIWWSEIKNLFMCFFKNTSISEWCGKLRGKQNNCLVKGALYKKLFKRRKLFNYFLNYFLIARFFYWDNFLVTASK